MYADQQDFKGHQCKLTFHGYYRGDAYCDYCNIVVYNDDVNEASVQEFIIELMLVNGFNPNLITLSRNVSLGKIIDDDCKYVDKSLYIVIIILLAIRIGFKHSSYTFTEPPFNIQLFTEDGRISEQTFIVQIQLQVSNANAHHSEHSKLNYQTFNITFPSNRETVSINMTSTSSIHEDVEEFHVAIFSVGFPNFLSDSRNVVNETLIVIKKSQS